MHVLLPSRTPVVGRFVVCASSDMRKCGAVLVSDTLGQEKRLGPCMLHGGGMKLASTALKVRLSLQTMGSRSPTVIAHPQRLGMWLPTQPLAGGAELRWSLLGGEDAETG